MKPSKRSWNGEFGGFRICVGWIPTTRFCVVGCGFLCTLLISFHFTANTPRAITPRATTSHPYHHGLSRLCIHPGYHTRAITLHHTRTSGYHTRHSSSYFVVLSFAGFYATCASPPTPPLGATRHNLLNMCDKTAERVKRCHPPTKVVLVVFCT